jgi:hypothetical protein
LLLSSGQIRENQPIFLRLFFYLISHQGFFLLSFFLIAMFFVRHFLKVWEFFRMEIHVLFCVLLRGLWLRALRPLFFHKTINSLMNWFAPPGFHCVQR